MNQKISVKDLFSTPTSFLALGFGAGLSPWAPGTFGTLVALPLIWLLSPLSDMAYVSISLAVFLVGIPVCEATAKLLSTHDHPAIVWDEIAGMMFVMAFVPFSVTALLLGFVLFRIFDIFKPWPIRAVDQRVGGGLGIMLDDLIAALFAAVLLRILLLFL